jgi:SAM-dependent methyltransferase
VAENSARGRVFDAIADTYARVRPHYPAALYDALDARVGLREGTSVLEIGCGPGIATAELLGRKCRVVAVEPGTAMAEAALSRHGTGLEVVVSTFEEWPLRERAFDLVLAATSIHWVTPEARWTKTAAALREGGSIALITNRTVSPSSFEELYRETTDLHARYVNEGTESPSSDELRAAIAAAGPDVGAVWGAIEPFGGAVLAGDLFGPTEVHTVEWVQRSSTADAIALLSTYSTYLILDPTDREDLFAAMADIIDEKFGGAVTRRYLAVLAIADKSSQP